MTLEPRILQIAHAVKQEGGRALIVGGYVRDQLLSRPLKDIDLEIHGLPLEKVEALLARFGEVIAVGRAFGVLQLKGLGVDIALPRRDSKVGTGHRGFDVEVDPHLGFEEASRRRDLTINSMGLDPLTEELLDPWGGQPDLEAKVLRATDRQHFGEDPLRALRVAQFGARLEMRPDRELLDLCRSLDLGELPGERLLEEFRKMLLDARSPSIGLEIMRDAELLRFFPELDALRGVPQDPRWHPEGDVWTHTKMVVDAATSLAEHRQPGSDGETLLFAALCHDLGKPATTERDGDRIRSHGHERAGVAPTRAFLKRLSAPGILVDRVCALIAHHLAPLQFVDQGAKARAYRRLARKLARSKATLRLLERLARSDQLGRTTEGARAGRFEQGDEFLRRSIELGLADNGPRDAVLGRHLLKRGVPPGPIIGALLEKCRALQDERGEEDPDRILDEVLGSEDADDRDRPPGPTSR